MHKFKFVIYSFKQVIFKMVMLFCSNKDSHAADDGDYQYMSQNTDHPNYDVIQMDQREASPGRHYENAAAAER